MNPQPDPNPQESDASPSFERAIASLESIIDRIESGEIGLEEAIRQYEQGTAMIKRCRAILAAAEERIAELTTDAEGNLRASESAGEADPDDDNAF